MTYPSAAVIEPVLDMVSTFGPWSVMYASGVYPGATSTYESANRTVYIPIVVPVTRGRVTARRVWWANGNSVNGASTIGVGIYSDLAGKPNTRIVNASAAQSGTNSIQFADITDTNLSPGRYWLAIVSSATATTNINTGSGAEYHRSLRFQEASNMPATATPASSGGSSNIYLFGFSTVASP